MFTASMIRRALDLQAPFLQCLKYFHTISVGDLQCKCHTIKSLFFITPLLRYLPHYFQCSMLHCREWGELVVLIIITYSTGWKLLIAVQLACCIVRGKNVWLGIRMICLDRMTCLCCRLLPQINLLTGILKSYFSCWFSTKQRFIFIWH